MFKKIPDTFHIGALLALIVSVLAWLLISRTEVLIATSALKDYLAFPRLYFIVFALQLVCRALSDFDWTACCPSYT